MSKFKFKRGDRVRIMRCPSRGGNDRNPVGTLSVISGPTDWSGKEAYVVDGNFYLAEDLEHANYTTEVEKAIALLKKHGTVNFIPKFKPISMNLNNEYEAVINQDHVKVGCQTFRFDRVLMLAEMVKKVQAEQM